jgi:hypothetical protein
MNEVIEALVAMKDALRGLRGAVFWLMVSHGVVVALVAWLLLRVHRLERARHTSADQVVNAVAQAAPAIRRALDRS